MFGAERLRVDRGSRDQAISRCTQGHTGRSALNRGRGRPIHPEHVLIGPISGASVTSGACRAPGLGRSVVKLTRAAGTVTAVELSTELPEREAVRSRGRAVRLAVARGGGRRSNRAPPSVWIDRSLAAFAGPVLQQGRKPNDVERSGFRFSLSATAVNPSATDP